MSSRAKRKRAGRPRKARGVSLAPTPANRWDMGPDTAAQRAGKVVEDASWFDELTGEKVNPNGVKRARRVDIVEMYEKRGVLDKRQVKAATILREAYEGTQRTAPAIKAIQVDSSPKPDAHIAIQIDRISKFSAIMRKVKSEYREIIDCVVLHGHIPAHLPKYRGRYYQKGIAHMQVALANLAENLDV